MVQVQGRSVLESFFWSLRAARRGFSLPIRHVAQRATRRYARLSVTEFTALTIHLFKSETFLVGFYPVLQPPFLPPSPHAGPESTERTNPRKANRI